MAYPDLHDHIAYIKILSYSPLIDIANVLNTEYGD
jgi:hypothetical protein